MRFALVNNIRTEAQPGLQGICPGCSQQLVAKCGEKKVNHWAHKRSALCDSWWEGETQWHRNWKDQFPQDCQEIFMPDPATGEKHIADVKTSHGLVIEFQHSPIKSEEQRSRETFYKNMIWIVDGTRLKLDYPRFCKWKKDELDCLRKSKKEGVIFMSYPEWWLPKAWIESKVMVVFDFGEQEHPNTPQGIIPLVWCLLPGRVGNKAVIVKGTREGFIKRLNNFSQPLPWDINNLMQQLTVEHEAELRKQRTNQSSKQRSVTQYHKQSGRYIKRRLF